VKSLTGDGAILVSDLPYLIFYRESATGTVVASTASRLSVCLSVTLRYRDHGGWNSSKIISRLISLGSSLSAVQCRPHNTYVSTPSHVQVEQPDFFWIGVGMEKWISVHKSSISERRQG